MKKIQKEITTYKDIFVSVDGREFTTAEDCEKWEKSYKGTLETSWKLIKKKEVCDCDFGFPWSSEDHECYALKPKNLDEIVLMNAYIKAETGEDGGLTTEHIDKLIILNFGCDRYGCDVDILSEHLAKVTERIANLEKEF